jgi:copper homeostasis protein
VSRAAGRIIIMPGCGIHAENIARIEAETKATEFHASARNVRHSRMTFRNENVSMGTSVALSEFETLQTDRRKVEALVR